MYYNYWCFKKVKPKVSEVWEWPRTTELNITSVAKAPPDVSKEITSEDRLNICCTAKTRKSRTRFTKTKIYYNSTESMLSKPKLYKGILTEAAKHHLVLINSYERKKQNFKYTWEKYHNLPNLTLQHGISVTENSTNQDL